MKILNIVIATVSLLLSGTLVAQSNIDIVEQGTSKLLNGDTLKINVDEIHIDVTNQNVNSVKIAITRVIISEPTQWNDQVCWGDGCYDALTNPYTTPNTGGFPAPTLDNGVSYELKPQYDPKNVKGVGHYRYYLTEEINFFDFPSIEKIKYSAVYDSDTLMIKSVGPSTAFLNEKHKISIDEDIAEGIISGKIKIHHCFVDLHSKTVEVGEKKPVDVENQMRKMIQMITSNHRKKMV